MRNLFGIIVSIAAGFGLYAPADALDRVTIRRGGLEQRLVGRTIVKAQDGGLLLETRDGAMWTVPPEELVDAASDDEPFVPASPDELAQSVLDELPAGFETYQTKHYLIVYNTSRAYAQWCGTLFERLYLGFGNYWSNRGFKPVEPDRLLVAVVFADRPSFVRYAQNEVGNAAGAYIGYYSPMTNRMTMYDLTGTAGTTADRGSAAQITQTLSRPEAFATVATIVHEATHQIIFNIGMHRRYADIPVWVSEGLAVYFESPDLDASKGWRTIGKVNAPRLTAFRAYLPRRPADSLVTLISEDKRMRDGQTAGQAYAEAWALNYFLINAKPQQYQAYMKVLTEKECLIWNTPEERLAEFRQAFGDDLAALDKEFVRFMARVR